jgi:predicted ATPase
MQDMTTLTNASPSTDQPFDEGTLCITSLKPDLMPQAGKDLIERLKNPDKGDQPDYIFFHGPKGCGKSALIDQLTAAIGADRVDTHYSALMSLCEKTQLPGEIRSNVLINLVNLACKQAQEKKCPHAVIVFDDFDRLYQDTSHTGKALLQTLFNSTFDCGDLHLLVLAESTSRTLGRKIENIRVSYPTPDQYKQLATYFAQQFKLEIEEMDLWYYYREPISDLREAMSKAARKYYVRKNRDTPRNYLGQPDLMPMAAKKLVKLLNDTKQKNQPQVIVFHGPSGSGRTTLIKDFINRINAASMWLDGKDMLDSYAAYPNQKEVKDSILNDLVNPTFQAKQQQKKSHAALVVQNLDALYNHRDTPTSQHIFDGLFNTQYLDEQQSTLLIVCKAQESHLEGGHNIRVNYPDASARKKLITYFLRDQTTYVNDIYLLNFTENCSLTDIKSKAERLNTKNSSSSTTSAPTPSSSSSTTLTATKSQSTAGQVKHKDTESSTANNSFLYRNQSNGGNDCIIL